MENCKTELRWTLFFFSMRYLAPTIVPTSATHSPREVLLVGRGWNRVPRRKVFMIYYMEEVLIRIVRGISIFYGGQGSRVDGRLGETSLIPTRESMSYGFPPPSFPSSYIFIGKHGEAIRYIRRSRLATLFRSRHDGRETRTSTGRGIDGRGRRVEREEGRGGWGFRVLNILAWRDLKQHRANDENCTIRRNTLILSGKSESKYRRARIYTER